MNAELLKYRKQFETELLEDILPYWIKYGVDNESDSFYGAVGMDNKPVSGINRSCVLNARILWTFSQADLMYSNLKYKEMADRAYHVLINHFYDEAYGGFFMEISSDNSMANAIKHTYAQAFAIYALCKYYEQSKSEKVLQVIQKTFEVLEAKTKDKNNLGYFEAFTREWKPIEENRMADNNEPKSMNTHLHVLEAYAALYKVWKNDLVEKRLRELLLIFLDKIIRPSGHLGIFFDIYFNEVKHTKGTNSFGHDIEASWLLLEAAEILGDKIIIEKYKTVAVKMADVIDREAVDKDGGLFLESTRFGSHIRTNKHWWPQAETLVGFMNAFQVSGDNKHWDTLKLSWSFIDKYVIDHNGGEWYTKVNRLGVPFLEEPENDPSPYYRNDWKIDPWKCPYHNGRAMMELVKRIDLLNNNQHE
jgi:mannobiose 2-epimerase